MENLYETLTWQEIKSLTPGTPLRFVFLNPNIEPHISGVNFATFLGTSERDAARVHLSYGFYKDSGETRIMRKGFVDMTANVRVAVMDAQHAAAYENIKKDIDMVYELKWDV